MKKIISCVAISLLSGLPVAALNEPALESAVFAAEAVQQPEMPVLEAWKQARIPQYLKLAETVMTQDPTAYLNPSFLGQALVVSVSRAMQARKTDKTPLTAEEQRAVYYAVYTLLPSKNCMGMMPFKNYQERYPVENWGYFKDASLSALNLVYEALKDIATEQPNYRNWLSLLNPLQQ